jgi:tRNA A37 threonylcarbamoyladenosine dehydratase
MLPTPEDEEREYKLHRRFDRMGRLVGDAPMKQLMSSHVLIVGLGGVGSFAAESIARSGVGVISLVDFDEICITNANRQLHALQGLTGKKKADVMAERLRRINPQAVVHSHPVFFDKSCADELLADRPDYVIDAIDHITSKCHLLARCRDLGIPVVTATGSGGRLDPTLVRVADLADTTRDPLAKTIRGILRDKYGFPGHGEPLGIQAVYSTEPHTEPEELTYDKGQGFRCVCPQGKNENFTCDARNMIYGTAGFVTGTFGLVCASVAVRHLID